ncbi:hypothetical protein EYF80_058393 [Liparis tanakae]|uniref:Uncharacterized protein n=1 Tax=Liparis tanakae TaxID=230148 RepID=A0A4Z2ESV6_9TELE|nr:hypothetical protein EYF80_058393 [Liparis tanakae]
MKSEPFAVASCRSPTGPFTTQAAALSIVTMGWSHLYNGERREREGWREGEREVSRTKAGLHPPWWSTAPSAGGHEQMSQGRWGEGEGARGI